MPAPYPANFDLNLAKTLGGYVDGVYAQYAAGTPVTPPPGLTQLAGLSAIESWKLGILSTILPWDKLPPVSFGYVASDGNNLYIVIRGTLTPLEWLDDATIKPTAFSPATPAWGNVTQGFMTLYTQLWAEIKAALDPIAAKGALPPIYITGHSLGAALALLVAAGIYGAYQTAAISYTFSGPRAGDPTFATAYGGASLPTWRMFNTEDLVPTLPLAAVEVETPNMGMHGTTPLTTTLPLLVNLFPSPYQHVGFPIPVTFHSDTIAGNHNLTALYGSL